jgi:leucyl aminopeptidase
LISSSFVPLRPIEFQFYSGEEAGLLGSQAIVKSYVSNKTPVYAQLQTDMTGYAGKTPNIAIVTDYTNSELTNTLRMLAKTYSKLPVVDTRCGYGCSDHASWNRAGISSAFHFETKMNSDNPNIHTPKDTLQFVSLNHVAEFIKTSLGFAVELSLFKQ